MQSPHSTSPRLEEQSFLQLVCPPCSDTLQVYICSSDSHATQTQFKYTKTPNPLNRIFSCLNVIARPNICCVLQFVLL